MNLLRSRVAVRIQRLALVGVLLVTGCTTQPSGGPNAASSPGASSAASATPAANIRFRDPSPAPGQPRVGGTLRFLVRGEPATLDPHKANQFPDTVALTSVYESLLENFNDELRPALAASWSTSTDSKTYTFKLQDATFHTGHRLSSADVKFSYERMQDPKTASPMRQYLTGLKSILTPDPATVVMELSTPNAAFLTIVANWRAGIVDSAAANDPSTSFDKASYGTGPFAIKEWVRGTRFSVVKNATYWRSGRPYLDGVVFTFNNDDNARAAALRSGTVDFITNLDPVFLKGVKIDPSLKWYGGSSVQFSNVVLNVQRAPFNDVRVRQAVFYAVDRDEIMQLANDGVGEPMNASFLPLAKWSALQKPIYGRPDPAKAKDLLRQAGVSGGLSVSLYFNGSASFHVRAAQVLQQQLKAIGITVELMPVDPAVLRTQVGKLDFDLAQFGTAGTLDPDELVTQLYLPGGSQNWSKFDDAEVTALATKARAELNRSDREKLYQQIQTIIATRGPQLMTYNWADFEGATKRVQGFLWDQAFNHATLRDVWLSEA